MKEFDVKNLGQKYFLGIEVAHSSKVIILSQQKYIYILLNLRGGVRSIRVHVPFS